MTLGLRDSRNRRRRRFWLGVVKWSIVLIAILAAGVYAYRTGSKLAELDVTQLREEVDQLTVTVDSLTSENEALEHELAAAKQNAQEWQTRYEREVPTGEIKRLTDMVGQKVRDGVALDRLAFLIEASDDIGACDNQPVTKRFIVPTPLYDGPNSWVGFADSSITVTARGESAVNDDGQPEGWYDPAKPVTLVFAQLGGETSEVSGELPLHHSMLVGDSEYRFTAVAGDRGFLNVTADRCKAP